MFDKELSQATEAMVAAIQRLGLPDPEDIAWTPTPFSGQWGFGTTAPFQVAAREARAGEGISVPTRAEEIAGLLLQEIGEVAGFVRAEAVKGYLNLYLDPADYTRQVLDTILEQGPNFGRGASKGDKVMVEYAQPNTLHSFHIGHARNAILGESVARIVEFAGFDTVRAAYPGDIGLGVATCLWAYQRFYKGQEPEGVHERGQWLANIYTEATSMLTPKDDDTPEQKEERRQNEAEVRDLLRRWDAGDPAILELWMITRQWSLDELDAILKILDIDIDVFFFESQVDQHSKTIVDELIGLGIAEDERPDGPVIVKIDEQLGLKKEKYRTAVILRSDGTALYLTRDLALAKEKFEKHGVDRSIYVVDVRQSLHFQQAFKILELWGFTQASKCYHMAYGFVTLPEGAMSARRGNVILFMDVLEESIHRVKEIIREKNPGLSPEEQDKVAEQVGLGALAYAMLSVDTVKDIVFDWDRALDFEGQAAPYIQYAHVRATSILKRAGQILPTVTPAYTLETAEVALLDRLSRFPDLVERAAEDYKPLLIANYAYDLAKDFTTFYQTCPVLQADDHKREVRLRLTSAAKQTLANCLFLLDIPTPEVM